MQVAFPASDTTQEPTATQRIRTETPDCFLLFESNHHFTLATKVCSQDIQSDQDWEKKALQVFLAHILQAEKGEEEKTIEFVLKSQTKNQFVPSTCFLLPMLQEKLQTITERTSLHLSASSEAGVLPS